MEDQVKEMVQTLNDCQTDLDKMLQQQREDHEYMMKLIQESMKHLENTNRMLQEANLLVGGRK